MNWKLFDVDGSFIQEVNCPYDASDFASMFGAKRLELNYKKEEAYILEKF